MGIMKQAMVESAEREEQIKAIMHCLDVEFEVAEFLYVGIGESKIVDAMVNRMHEDQAHDHAISKDD